MAAIAIETSTAFPITPVKTYTKTRVIEAMEAVVEEFGADYLYRAPNGGEACEYAYVNDDDNWCPSCLIGQVLFRLGFPIERLKGMSGAINEILPDVEEVGFRFTVSAVNAMMAAQQVQDRAVGADVGDFTWGAALNAAKENTK